ncbi:hypothetical protein BKI51_07120 [Alphaproteobacteria bacterium AO1-B]|nr:hypothetical protein BKI51_07120 [Alphaproteobacteria bacterium AO1-B]
MSAQGRERQSTAASAASGRPIDTARLKSALKVTALLVQKLGDDYLPFFMRLETELAQLEAKEAARARVKKVLENG